MLRPTRAIHAPTAVHAPRQGETINVYGNNGVRVTVIEIRCDECDDVMEHFGSRPLKAGKDLATYRCRLCARIKKIERDIRFLE